MGVTAAQSDWPGGLNDEEAIQRLQTIAVAACDGVRDLSNQRDYSTLRRRLLSREDLRDVVPSFIRSQRDLNSLAIYTRHIADQRNEGRSAVWAAFNGLFARIRGESSPPITAGSWTGRRTITQQARIVLSLAPNAYDAVDMLLDEQERPLHNGGPVRPDRLEAIHVLRDLHSALGELIEIAQAGQPLSDHLARIRKLRDKVMDWSKDTYELMLVQSPLVASSAVYGSALWFLINIMTRDVAASATMAGSVVAGSAVLAKRKEPKRAG